MSRYTAVGASLIVKWPQCVNLVVPFGPKSTAPRELDLRTHLETTLEELPNNLPQYDKFRLLDDLCFLLSSPLFLYAIGPRLRNATSHTPNEPMTPISMCSGVEKAEESFRISNLDIRIRWDNDGSWASQLVYGDITIVEGRQLNVNQEAGFTQSFFWLCEEASFLAYEYRAREHAFAVRTGNAVDYELMPQDEWGGVVDMKGWERTNDAQKKTLRLRIRFRDTSRGQAGVWRIE